MAVNSRAPKSIGAATLTLLVALLLAAEAGAKVTCEQRGEHREDVQVAGLPVEPVAGESYELTVTSETADATDRAPRLMVMRCDAAGPEGFGPWTRADATGDPEVFEVAVRFPEPGRYGISVIDNGLFHDAGLHRVVPIEAATDDAGSVVTGGPSGPVLIGAAVALVASVAGVSLAARRRASSAASR